MSENCFCENNCAFIIFLILILLVLGMNEFN
jgi:hypothetical protein